MSSQQNASKKKKKKSTGSNTGSIGRGKAACRDCLSVILSAHRAALSGHTACLKGLLAAEKRGKRRLFPIDRNGATPLHLAARENNVEAIRLLLKSSRFNANSPGLRGETAVHVAAVRDALESLELLVSFNPRDMTGILGDVDGRGFTPLALACVKNRRRVIAWILENFGLIGFIIRNENRTTAAHLAAAAGNLETLKLLADFKRKVVWYRDTAGCSPLYFAAQEGHLRCVEYLVEEAKAEPLAQAKDGMTAIHAAAQGGHTRVAEYLIEKVGVAEVMRQTADGATPIHFAAAKGHDQTLAWLLRIGGRLAANMRDHQGCTPAHDAADAGFSRCLKVLVKAGADLFLEDKEGMSPYTLALSQQKEHPTCALVVQQLWAQSWGSGINHKQLPFSNHRPAEFTDKDEDIGNEIFLKEGSASDTAAAPAPLSSFITSKTLERQIRKLSSEIGMESSVDVEDLYARVVPKHLRRSDSKTTEQANPPPPNSPTEKMRNLDSDVSEAWDTDSTLYVAEDAAKASQKRRKGSVRSESSNTLDSEMNMMSELETVFESRGLRWQQSEMEMETHM